MNALIVDDEIDACLNIEYVIKKYFDASINHIQKAHSAKEAEGFMNEKKYIIAMTSHTLSATDTVRAIY